MEQLPPFLRREIHSPLNQHGLRCLALPEITAGYVATLLMARQKQQQQQQARPEIPAPPAEKPVADDDRSEDTTSPDTQLTFPEDDEHDEAATVDDEAKASVQDKVSRQAARSVGKNDMEQLP
ncbi:uncharacterized protein LOC125544774 isoform X2 [Triticum urartu]|uniref:uncharacterized protein LOC125544774 isoform X2 n=1 Tax=Triticum urartu TaxID=4572 RepID=UPI0020444571|nr:uncharacterized protein LOC125544774 isoform X2 [Triticum urartu]